MNTRKNIDLKIVYGITCLLAVWLFFLLPASKPYGLSRPEPVEVLIEPGQSAAEVSEGFMRAGLVKDSKALLKWMARLDFDRRLKPGCYTLRPGTAKQVAGELRNAVPLVLDVRVLPGAAFEDVASALKARSADELLKEALADEANFPEPLRPLLPGETEDRFLFLTPETYAIAPGDSAARQLVRSASRQWWHLHKDDVPEGATSADLRNGGILASIIQKEALFDAERPLMAGVFGNRLRKDMPMQSCATVVYAWKLRGVKRTSLTYDDLKIESPYNTYRHNGLPPGHIGIPSGNSWRAALNPQKTDNLFFVADKSGCHIFSKTYEEHLAAQRRINGGKR